MPHRSEIEKNDEEIARLRDTVLKWISVKKALPKNPPSKNVHEKNSQSTETHKNPKHTNKKYHFIPIVFGIGLLLLVSLLIYSGGLYIKHWNGPFTVMLTKYVPIPAAVVNGDIIRYSTWQEQARALSQYYAATGQDSNTDVVPNSNEIKQHVFDRLVEQQLVKQLATRYTISIDEEDIVHQQTLLTDELGQESTLENEISHLYGWSAPQFSEQVIKPLMLKNKLEIALTLDDRVNYAKRKQAEDFLNQIKRGAATFEDIAERYSEDVSAVQGGDLGYFKLSEMVPEFSAAVEKLEVGEVSDVVKTQFGYHIIKLEERIADETGDLQVRAKHILIRNQSIDEYIRSYRTQSRILKFLVI